MPKRWLQPEKGMQNIGSLVVIHNRYYIPSSFLFTNETIQYILILMESSMTKLGWFYMYVSWLFVAKLCISDYFSYVEYQDLCATINPSKIKDLEEQKQSLKHLCNINWIGFLEKPGLIVRVISDTTRIVPYNRLTIYPNR